MSTLHLICVAMQLLMKKPTQRLFSMLIRQKKEEQLSLMSTHLTQMSSFCSSEGPQIPKEILFVTGRGTQQRRIQMKNIYDELGPAKAAALPRIHAFTGADITGSFTGKGKLQCWKIFNQADEDVIQAFTDLGSSEEISENICIAIEKFVCRLYHSKSKITEIGELQWLMFRQKQWQAQKLAPTRASLIPTIQRAHFQALTWFQDNQAQQVLSPV